MQSPYDKKDIFLMLVSGVVSLHRTSHFSFFGISGWGIDLDCCDVEWFALKMNQDHSVVFENVPKYYVLDSFINLKSYSTSSKGFLSTVVDILII